MKRNGIRRGAAIMLALLLAINSITGHGIVPGLVSRADERAAIVNATTLNVRSGAGTGFALVDKLTNGAPVAVLGEMRGSDGMVWYQIRFSGSTGGEKTGYVRSDYIRFPATYTNDADFEAYLTNQGFPESYKTGLRQLHAMYPNWVFTAQHTNLDWNTVLENESLVGRNLVYDGSISSWKSTADGAYNWESSTWPSFDSGSYVAASTALIAYYMDPRNFLDDKYVFQFLLHSYDASVHTAEGLRSMVEGTFLAGSAAVSSGYGTPAGTQDGSTGYGPMGGPFGAAGSPGVSTQGPAGSTSSGVSTQSPTGSANSGVSTQIPGGQGSSSIGSGVSTQGPAGSSSSGVSTQAPGSQGNSSSNSGVSTQGPSGSTNSGVSQQAPGVQSSAGNGSVNSGVSQQAPGVQSSAGNGSANSGVSQQAPSGQKSASSGNSNSGVSLQAPGAQSSAGSRNSGSGVSLQAPGSVASAVGGSGSLRILGSAGMLFGGNHLLLTLPSGLTTGPGGNTSSSGPSTSYGPMGSVGNTSSPSAGSGTGAPTADYVNIIMNAGAQSGVNPYVLAAMIIQEQGTQGNSNSISGTVSGYEGYYNFFNIEAYRSGDMEATTRGLWYASQSGSYGRPWNSIDKSITGGALYYGTNYVKVGQDTFYLKKFNVQGTNLYKHQYMTNVQGAASEGAKLSEAYSAQLKQTSRLEFKIPVYRNMPDAACAKPTVDGSPNNKLSGLGVEGFTITPTFNMNTTTYDLIVNSSVTEVRISATAYSASASISGTGTISLQSGNNEIPISVRAENGDVRVYVIRVVKQQNGPSYNSSLGSGVSGSLSPGAVSGPGGSSASPTGPFGSVSSGGGSSAPASPGGSTAGPLSSGSSTGPGGTSSGVVSSEGPGSVSSGNSSGGYGPGGSNVTVIP